MTTRRFIAHIELANGRQTYMELEAHSIQSAYRLAAVEAKQQGGFMRGVVEATQEGVVTE